MYETINMELRNAGTSLGYSGSIPFQSSSFPDSIRLSSSSVGLRWFFVTPVWKFLIATCVSPPYTYACSCLSLFAFG
jgi:hypothetical protein